MTARFIAQLLAATFVLVGVIGFIPNPLVSAEGLFVTNTMHNLVHVATGALFVLALIFAGRERQVILAVGAVYGVVAGLGFLTQGDYLLGMVQINQADRWLHLVLAIVILALGAIASQESGAGSYGDQKTT